MRRKEETYRGEIINEGARERPKNGGDSKNLVTLCVPFMLLLQENEKGAEQMPPFATLLGWVRRVGIRMKRPT